MVGINFPFGARPMFRGYVGFGKCDQFIVDVFYPNLDINIVVKTLQKIQGYHQKVKISKLYSQN